VPSLGFDGNKVTDEINLWRSLTYHDPVTILKRLRALEVQLAGVEMDERVRRLRTPGLKTYREARMPPFSSTGWGWQRVAMHTPLLSGPTTIRRDMDGGTTQHFCPVS